jgi:flagellar export protein FliJ
MPFRFSLESILSFRKNIEHAEELSLNKILHEIASIQMELERIEKEYRLFRAQRERDLAKGLTAAYLQELGEKEQYLENSMEILRAQLRELDIKRAAQLAILRAAQQNREVLDEMRKQKHTTYQHEQNRREQKAMDDLFLARIKDDN